MSVQAESQCGGVRSRHANAFDMKDTRAGVLNVDIWHNDITKIGGATIGSLKRIAKPIDRIVNSWLHAWLGEEYSSSMLTQMNMPKPKTSLLLDFSSIIGPLFFVWLVQLPLPYAVVQLVYEKEKRLRTMMKIHGLENGTPPASVRGLRLRPFTRPQMCSRRSASAGGGCRRYGRTEHGLLLCRSLHHRDVHLLHHPVPPLHHHHAHCRQRSRPAVRPSPPATFGPPSTGGHCLPARLDLHYTPAPRPAHAASALTAASEAPHKQAPCTECRQPILLDGMPTCVLSLPNAETGVRHPSGPFTLEAGSQIRPARGSAGAVRPPA